MWNYTPNEWRRPRRLRKEKSVLITEVERVEHQMTEIKNEILENEQVMGLLSTEMSSKTLGGKMFDFPLVSSVVSCLTPEEVSKLAAIESSISNSNQKLQTLTKER